MESIKSKDIKDETTKDSEVNLDLILIPDKYLRPEEINTINFVSYYLIFLILFTFIYII